MVADAKCAKIGVPMRW